MCVALDDVVPIQVRVIDGGRFPLGLDIGGGGDGSGKVDGGRHVVIGERWW
jgi:hypothetical protein